MYHSPSSYGLPLYYYGMRTYFPYINDGVNHRQMKYMPVTAYTAVQPVLVNGEDINTGPYPVLNFQPEGAQAPYIYVPIAQFSKVGASVKWNENANQMWVETDYSINKSLLAEYKAKYDMLETGQVPVLEKGPSPELEDISYDGKIEEIGMYQVGGILSNLVSDEKTNALTPGKSYKGYIDAPDPTTKPPRVSWIILIDDNGHTVAFSTTRA
ncbi:hypothetical protein J7E63_21740 [Bacillus sp. ISL-75]|uniref:hypothetical protein n=1 Tax=Bacillus sp. ISL-75 TaxID=2819137 RepID=UPI001BE5AFC9|nr:hypothetical protein [Bacillus sp. ISL-75]MBT2729516.1 hypothetical protein [Bacillus sp. ISL-75]